MQSCHIRPSDFAGVFGKEFGDVFLLVTSPRVRERLQVERDSGVELAEQPWEGAHSRSALLARFEELRRAGRKASVVWIADDEFEHYSNDELKGIKLAALSSFSAPFTVEALARTLAIVRDTDYQQELEIERSFLEKLDGGKRILFRSASPKAEATLEYQQLQHWFSLHGALSFGQQVVAPTGELSMLLNGSGEFDAVSRFPLDGQILLQGQPIVHRGSRTVALDETMKTYDALAAMREQPALVDVRGGEIVGVHPAGGGDAFCRSLTQFLEREPLYRKIHEIGFGTSLQCKALRAENFAANERYPGVHFGLGLGGHTQFHIDLVCTKTDVLVEFADGRTEDVYQYVQEVPRK
ncbi:MAG TPA: hypothetical protein VEU33_47895 [Archangium sp.]|nr:hypothetical protein [Archangium sp.]